MPYYCTVPRCTSMAGKAKNVSFHQFPRDEELAKLWNDILKRGKPYTKYSKVCSLHFKPEDYTITSVGKNKGQWRTLRKDAVPSQNLPSESPAPYTRRSSGSWVPGQPSLADPLVQQQMAQAIYMQTMLAMQAAGASEPLASSDHPQTPEHTEPSPSGSALSEIELLLRRDTEPPPRDIPYKCQECSKCFKDPDVYILHKRTHKNDTLTNKIEKENYSANIQDREETLRANPILANLLKTSMRLEPENNITNILSVENQIMTALASNMEAYIRTLTSVLSNQHSMKTESEDKCEDKSQDESDDYEEVTNGDKFIDGNDLCEEETVGAKDANDAAGDFEYEVNHVDFRNKDDVPETNEHNTPMDEVDIHGNERKVTKESHDESDEYENENHVDKSVDGNDVCRDESVGDKDVYGATGDFQYEENNYVIRSEDDVSKEHETPMDEDNDDIHENVTNMIKDELNNDRSERFRDDNETSDDRNDTLDKNCTDDSNTRNEAIEFQNDTIDQNHKYANHDEIDDATREAYEATNKMLIHEYHKLTSSDIDHDTTIDEALIAENHKRISDDKKDEPMYEDIYREGKLVQVNPVCDSIVDNVALNC